MRHIHELGVVQLVRDLNGFDGATTVLSQDDIGLASPPVIAVLRGRPVEQHNHIRVMLQRAGLAQISQLRLFIGTRLRTTV